MTLEYKENEITFMEKNTGVTATGYFSADGEFINFSTLLDVPCHDGDNTIPPAYEFLNWVSYIIEDTNYKTFGNIKNRQNLKYPGMREVVKRGYEDEYGYNTCGLAEFRKELDNKIKLFENELKNYHSKEKTKEFLFKKWQYYLLIFFKNAYSKKPFFEAIDRKIKVDNPDKIFKKFDNHKKICYGSNYDWGYGFYIRKQILKDHFKDICIQYLGYDSLERFSVNGNLLKPIKSHQMYIENSFEFQKTPRIITSSSLNPNERFFNYLLMNWEIHILPKYIFNEKNGIYEKNSECLNLHYNDKEEIHRKEIESIKRLVPLKERYKYFI